jgi:hypothetical protein
MTTPEARLVRLETEAKNAIQDLTELLQAFDRANERLIQHDERIERNRHDIRNLKQAVRGVDELVTKMGRTAYDLVAEEHKLRNEAIEKERIAREAGDAAIAKQQVEATKEISQTLVSNEEKRRNQLDTWFRRVGFGAWTVTSAVAIAYLVSLVT